MTNKIIAQSSRFRAVRTSRDRVRIKGQNSKIELASILRCKVGDYEGTKVSFTYPNPSQDLLTFVEAARRALE